MGISVFNVASTVKDQTLRNGATGSTLAGTFPRGRRATAPSGVQVAEIHTVNSKHVGAAAPMKPSL